MKSSDECLELAQRLAEGTANEEDTKQLSDLLRYQPDLRQVYLSFMALHSALTWEFREIGADEVVGSSPNPTVVEPERIAQPNTSASRRSRRLGLVTVAAAGILAIFFAARMQSSAFASRLIESALIKHAEPVEYEYLVDVVWDNPKVAQTVRPKDVRVSTQGDRFWISIKMLRHLAIGNQPDGSMWIALSPLRGIVIEQQELGPVLRDVNDLYSLRVESMLDGVLKNHRLQVTAENGSTYVINAVPRQERGWIQEVTIELDRDTRVVQRLIAKRRSALRGPSTVTFTLADTKTTDASKYSLAGHLSQASRVLTRENSNSGLRTQVLENVLGPVSRGWILETEAAPHD